MSGVFKENFGFNYKKEHGGTAKIPPCSFLIFVPRVPCMRQENAAVSLLFFHPVAPLLQINRTAKPCGPHAHKRKQQNKVAVFACLRRMIAS